MTRRRFQTLRFHGALAVYPETGGGVSVYPKDGGGWTLSYCEGPPAGTFGYRYMTVSLNICRWKTALRALRDGLRMIEADRTGGEVQLSCEIEVKAEDRRNLGTLTL